MIVASDESDPVVMQEGVVSVITPCYNSGKYLMEAVDSVRAITDTPHELIVVDDGSTEAETLAYLDELRTAGITVLVQANSGPASARNTGVRSSSGEFLLFLDSDNMIKPEFLVEALAAMRSNPEVGVVYARPVFFGVQEEEPRFEVLPFSMDRLLVGNFIDMCSVVRRSAWESVDGLDVDRRLTGREDWEFWIRLARAGWHFHLIDKELFHYRVRENSLTTAAQGENNEQIVDYVSAKNHDIIFAQYKYYFRLYMKVQERPVLFCLKILYSKYVRRSKYPFERQT
jgi:glycosyltransferase involved in cell wall biosynthesis